MGAASFNFPLYPLLNNTGGRWQWPPFTTMEPQSTDLIQTVMLDIRLIDNNDGQVPGLPANPRFIKDKSFDSLVKSMQDHPKMLALRELVVYPFEGRYVAVCGNQRLRGGRMLEYQQMPSKILPMDTTIADLKAYAIKDNNGWGDDDMEALANEWADVPLVDWGTKVPKTWEEATGDESFDQSQDLHKEKKAYGVVIDCGDLGHEEAILRDLRALGYDCRTLY